MSNTNSSESMLDRMTCNRSNNDSSSYSLQSMTKALKIGFAITTALTVLLLLIALIAACGGDEGCREDGEEGGGLTFAMIWMLLMSCALGLVGWFTIWKSSSAMTPRFRVGFLGGSLVLYANMALVCAIYFWSIEASSEMYCFNLRERLFLFLTFLLLLSAPSHRTCKEKAMLEKLPLLHLQCFV